MKPFTAALISACWAMEPGYLKQFFAGLEGLEGHAAKGAADESDAYGADPGPIVADGIATIDIAGMLMKSVPGWMDYFGIAATGYDRIAAAIAKAEADPKVASIQFVIDSPGGSTTGLQSLVDQIAACTKPTQALCEDLCASAAYAIASQCDQVLATPGSMVGSIGTYMVAVDASRMAENQGITVHVISSGPEKGGAFGAAISDQALAGMQKIVNDLTAMFVGNVASGRGMAEDKVKALATGAVWLAKDAAANGLIDGVARSGAARASLGKLATAHVAATKSPVRAFASAGSRTNPAGAKPATKESTMSMTKERMAELCKANPTHQALIVEMFAADKEDAEVVAAVQSAETSALRVSVTDLTSKLAKAATDHQSTIAGKDQEIAAKVTALAAMTKERDDLKALGQVEKIDADGATPAKKVEKPKYTLAQAQGGKIPKADLESGNYVLVD
jgi:signal peptide peptidase SppA